MKLRTSEYFLREVILSLRRHHWMSFASVSTVAVSLLVLGIFCTLVINLNHMASLLESQVQISVYLKDSVQKKDIESLESHIQKLQGIASVQYVPREEAMQRLQTRLGDQSYLLTALDDQNPLPNAFEVTVTKPELVETTAQAIEKFTGVESAKYGQDVVAHLFDVTRFIRVLGFLLMLLLAGATLFIISNTIRLTVFARRKEIAIMKYVGATDWFIRWPFLIEGMVLGFGGGVLAALALRGLYDAVTAKVYSILAFLPLEPAHPFLEEMTVGLVISGMVVGALGSSISLKRFLKV